MERVTGYRLTDGRVIEDFDEATKEQKELTFLAAIEELTDEYGGYNDSQQAVIQFIVDNPEDLYKILHEYFK